MKLSDFTGSRFIKNFIIFLVCSHIMYYLLETMPHQSFFYLYFREWNSLLIGVLECLDPLLNWVILQNMKFLKANHLHVCHLQHHQFFVFFNSLWNWSIRLLIFISTSTFSVCKHCAVLLLASFFLCLFFISVCHVLENIFFPKEIDQLTFIFDPLHCYMLQLQNTKPWAQITACILSFSISNIDNIASVL
jgi:hypothetical protein